MSVLHPTKARLRLMRDIRDGKVVEYTTETPALIFSPTEDRAVTARVEELARAGLVTRDTPVHTYFKIPALTADGEAWLDTYGKNGADT